MRGGWATLRHRMARKALFLDRDGVLDELVHHADTGEWEAPRSASEMRLLPGVGAALRGAAAAGWMIFVVSNQPDAAKGKTTRESLDAAHRRLLELLPDASVTEFFYCFHRAEDRCRCRKPQPYFLQEAARKYDIDLNGSWFVGDVATDVDCGRRAGTHTAMLLYEPSASKRGDQVADVVCIDLADFVRHLLVDVVILAGGLGTRLGALTRDTPKPMIEVAGRPFLHHVIESFRARGLTDIVLLIGRYGEQIEDYFGDGSRVGVHIRYSREAEPIGTGGALREARHLLAGRFLLTYADVLRRYDYDRFVQQHSVCLAVYRASVDGNTDVENGRVTRFDKSAKNLPYTDAGFCVMPSSTIDLLPKSGACSFEEIVFPRLAGEMEAEIVDHDFVEIGTPEALAAARARLVR